MFEIPNDSFQWFLSPCVPPGTFDSVYHAPNEEDDAECEELITLLKELLYY